MRSVFFCLQRMIAFQIRFFAVFLALALRATASRSGFHDGFLDPILDSAIRLFPSSVMRHPVFFPLKAKLNFSFVSGDLGVPRLGLQLPQ